MILSVANSAGPRNIESKKVQGLYPEGLRESSSTLISFIERYYEHINSVGLPSYEISNITSDKDIDIASDKYLTNIQSLIAKTIPNTSSLDKVTLYKIVLQYYNSRGSEDSIFAFFKLFYDEVVSIFYPRDYLFDLSGGSGEWGDINYSTIAKCLTNPNKTTMVVSSDTPIGPNGELVVYLTYIGNNVWSYKGLDHITNNIPFIERYHPPYYDGSTAEDGWIFTFDTLQNVTTVDAIWPDEATWGSMQDALMYDEKLIEYIDSIETRPFIYKHGFSIYAESTEALVYGESIWDSVNKTLYSANVLNPTVWVVDNVLSRWKYSDHKSFASDNYKLHDGYYWQKYSYEIKSEQSSDIWLNDYLRFVHPAGLKLFSAVLLKLFAKSEWYALIDYEASKESFDFVNKCRPPTLGYHTPTYQPGWLSFGPKTYSFIITVLRDVDPALVSMVLMTIGLLKEADNNRNSIIRSDYQSWAKNIDSTQLCAAYTNKTIAESMEDYSNTNTCVFNNISCYVNIVVPETPYFLSRLDNIESIITNSKYDHSMISVDNNILSDFWSDSELIHLGTISKLVLNNNTTLAPEFSTSHKTYAAIVSNTVTSIVLTPTTLTSSDTIKINGTIVESGTASNNITLDVGENIITILVTAEDEITTSTYTITVTRLV